MSLVSLEVEAVGKSFGGPSTITGVSFRVHPAEFVAVLGPSGAGKTTLFRCIAGLIAPSEGRIRILGAGTGHLRRRQRCDIAVVFQQFNLIARRSALGNVLAGRLGHVSAWRGITGRFSRQDKLWALECLNRVGMLDHAERRADTLSGGQQQRVAIARAIAQRPGVILADEPVSSLDPQTSRDVLDLLRDICRREGVAVVCSLHQVDLARAYADRIVGLANGHVVMDIAATGFDAAAFTNVYGTAAEVGAMVDGL
ncbi:MAG: phosphonate ABC transporter ATP-binding protein [Acetobacteraceae bacterium]|nr:phosphonate ABC transporter ATP-binding protein [Acetobacteraceae bacterium]